LVDDFPRRVALHAATAALATPEPLGLQGNSVFAKPLSQLFQGHFVLNYTVGNRCLSTVLAVFKKRGTGLAPAQADIDEGHEKTPKRGHEKRPSRDQRTGLVGLCRKERVLAMEVEIVKRASAYSSGRTRLWLTAHHAVAG
jgi:hypothetical protein